MVTTLYLIRHGETEGAEKKRYKGSIDVPLSEHGIRQMEQVSAYLVKGIHNCSNPFSNPLIMDYREGLLSAVYCSDLQRATRSAQVIAKPHSLSPVIVPSFRERNFGIWEGMSFDEIKLKYPDEFHAWAGNPLEFSPMGGESTLEVRDRVINAMDRIIDKHNQKINTLSHPSPSRREGNGEGEHVVIVAHGGVNRIILCHLLGIPLANIFRIDQDYGALNIIEFWEKYPIVKLINGIMYS
ncbi:MAG: histidine phosphatase family protein [Thermodesulfovibrionales bacterium]|nr:histidine phosphatase family protein [Thermodesulfovibrionales bacterium]